jgi:hypothetical protein
MRDAALYPSVALPLALALGLTLAVGLGVAPAALDSLIDHIQNSPDLDATQRDEVIRFIEEHEPLATGLLATGGVLSMLLTVFLWAGILHAGTSMTFAEKPAGLAFRNTFSVVAHANLVNVPLAILQAALLASGSDASVSLAGLLGIPLQSPLGAAAAWVAPVNAWWLALLGLGVAAQYGAQFSRTVWIPVAISLGLRVIHVAFAALTSGASP